MEPSIERYGFLCDRVPQATESCLVLAIQKVVIRVSTTTLVSPIRHSKNDTRKSVETVKFKVAYYRAIFGTGLPPKLIRCYDLLLEVQLP